MSVAVHERRTDLLHIAVMSFLAPIIGGAIETTWIALRAYPTRYYLAVFYPDEAKEDQAVRLVLIMIVQGLVTFVLIWVLSRKRAWLEWPVFILSVALWTAFYFMSIGVH